MNVLDRALAVLAPRLALQRAAARDMLRSYVAGSSGRLTQGWRPPRGSPDNVLDGGRALLQARSRDLGRNNPWMATALRRLPAAIVGTGPTASVQGSKRVRQQVAEDWAAFCDEGDLDGRMSFAAMLALLMRAVPENGEAFIVWQSQPSGDGRAVPLGWRLLPVDYLDESKLGTAPAQTPGGVIRGGIEYDAGGRVVAYWLFPRHPDDADFSARRPVSDRYPAEQVDHIFERLWIGQRRGVPWFAPVAVPADDLQQYEVAALWKARMAASLGLVLESGGPAPSSLSAPATDAAGRQLEQLAPGAILRLRSGEKATQVTPPADDNFRNFWHTRMLAVAAGLGLPYASLTGDLSQANYSSLREGKLLFWELLDAWQRFLVEEQVLRSAWRRFGLARFAAGRTAGGKLPGVKWGFPARPWVDPWKDMKAIELELDLALASWPDTVAARGQDPEQQLAEVASWKARLEAAGIRLGRQARAGATAAPAAAAADPADPAEPADPTATE